MPTVCWATVLDVRLLTAYKRGRHDNKYDSGKGDRGGKGTRGSLRENIKLEKSCENY